jgi:hypothetical protein
MPGNISPINAPYNEITSLTGKVHTELYLLRFRFQKIQENWIVQFSYCIPVSRFEIAGECTKENTNPIATRIDIANPPGITTIPYYYFDVSLQGGGF